ncbi:MAG: putative NEK protein kinase, partial [Streblomastix strix]
FPANFPFNTSWKKSDFEQKELLGRGRLGAVSHVIERRTQRHAAWKEVNYTTQDEVIQTDNEIAIMRKIYEAVSKQNHPSLVHIVQPLGFFVDIDTNKGYFVMELCSKGDLWKYIENMKAQRNEVSPELAYKIIGQVASSIKQLHVNGIMHSNLKLENVLLTSDLKVKLADFGLQRQYQVGRGYMTTLGGSFLYLGPEIIRSRINMQVQAGYAFAQAQQTPYNPTQYFAADIWAFGVMMFELIAQHHPFFNSKTEVNVSAEEFIHRIVNTPPAELPERYPQKLKELIKYMLNKDPSRRIRADQILEISEVAAVYALN